MWIWPVLGIALLVVLTARLRRPRVRPDRELAKFFAEITDRIRRAGPEYGVRGIVPGTMTMVISVRGQEVPVPMENVFRHFVMFPDFTENLVRQLLDEIEEVGLERPSDRLFSDTATQIMPQICTREWVFEKAPAFGDGAIVHRELGPDLAICYVVDDPWSIVFVCNAHLRQWGRREADLYHLAIQNLRRRISAPPPLPGDAPISIHTGDGYDASRVLLLDPDAAGDLLVAMPARESLYLAREQHVDRLAEVLRSVPEADPNWHPLSREIYRFEAGRLVALTAPVLE